METLYNIDYIYIKLYILTTVSDIISNNNYGEIFFISKHAKIYAQCPAMPATCSTSKGN